MSLLLERLESVVLDVLDLSNDLLLDVLGVDGLDIDVLESGLALSLLLLRDSSSSRGLLARLGGGDADVGDGLGLVGEEISKKLNRVGENSSELG